MNKLEMRLVLTLTVVLMLLATRVRADPVTRVVLQGTTYDIVPTTDPLAATFTLDGQSYTLLRVALTASPATRPATLPTTTPATRPAAPIRPSPATAGVPAGIVLSPAAANTIKPNCRYDGLSFAGTLTVNLAKGQTLTLRNCRIDAAGAAFAVRCDRNLGKLVIDHCEIVNASSAAIYGSNFDATANHVHRIGGDGFKPISAALIQGNYVAELGWNNPTAHADGVQISGGSDIRIIGNFFNLPLDVPNTKCNAVLFLQNASHDVVFEGNWCAGGNFAIHAYADSGGNPSIRITNNTFTTKSTRYGFGSIGTSVVWTGNVNEAGNPVSNKDK